nr:hypothetical protein [Aggregatibacter actinomycetemcomitans]
MISLCDPARKIAFRLFFSMLYSFKVRSKKGTFKRYYPLEFTRLSGIRNTASTTCFVLQANQQRTLFSFFNVGSLKLKDNQSLSACVNDEE